MHHIRNESQYCRSTPTVPDASRCEGHAWPLRPILNRRAPPPGAAAWVYRRRQRRASHGVPTCSRRPSPPRSARTPGSDGRPCGRLRSPAHGRGRTDGGQARTGALAAGQVQRGSAVHSTRARVCQPLHLLCIKRTPVDSCPPFRSTHGAVRPAVGTQQRFRDSVAPSELHRVPPTPTAPRPALGAGDRRFESGPPDQPPPPTRVQRLLDLQAFTWTSSCFRVACKQSLYSREVVLQVAEALVPAPTRRQ